MDFYARQAAARAQSRWLVAALAAAIAAVVLTLSWLMLAVMAARSFDDTGSSEGSQTTAEFARTHPQIAVFCVLLWSAVILVSSAWKSLLLRGGGGAVARSLGGTRVERGTSDPRLRRLRNVVEEMSIASGVPTPEIWVLEDEDGINAFAAGHSPANAAITVTRGAVARLRRDELQGVIAHEFSHILNGDMRLNVRLMGWLFGLMVIGVIGRTILRLSGNASSRRGAGGFLLVAFAMMLLGYLGLFLGRLIQAAVSRHRERLADASAVQFTRNPDGLKGALLMIAGVPASSRITSGDADQVAHMLFASGMQRLFATHPSLGERVAALDPQFDVSTLEQRAQQLARQNRAEDDSDLLNEAMQATAGGIAALSANDVQADPQAIARQVGNPLTMHMREAQAQRLALPAELRDFVESSGQARALLLAQLISRDPPLRERQLALLTAHLGAAESALVERALPLAAQLDPWLRLPAVLQLLPGLRRLARTERQELLVLVDQMIRIDDSIDVFEFCLVKLVSTSLRDELGARDPHGSDSLAAAARDIGVLFAVLAREGSSDAVDARRAYEAGMSRVLPRERPDYSELADWPAALDAALSRLEQLHPFAKRALVEGLVATIAHDGRLALTEAELLRTVCATLQCPLPPLLPAAA